MCTNNGRTSLASNRKPFLRFKKSRDAKNNGKASENHFQNEPMTSETQRNTKAARSCLRKKCRFGHFVTRTKQFGERKSSSVSLKSSHREGVRVQNTKKQ